MYKYIPLLLLALTATANAEVTGYTSGLNQKILM